MTSNDLVFEAISADKDAPTLWRPPFFWQPIRAWPSELLCQWILCHSVKDWAKSQILANSISKQFPFYFARHPISCDSAGAFFQDFHVFIQCCHSRSFISKHGNKAGTVLIVALDLALLYLRIITGRSGQAIHSVRSRPSTLLGSSGSATNPIFCLDPKHPQSQPKLHYSLQSLQVSCRPRLRGSAGPKSSGS